MARITVEDCLEKVDNQYDLVLLAKERTFQLNAVSPMLVEEDNDKRTIISLREIGDGKINVKEDISKRKIITSEKNKNLNFGRNLFSLLRSNATGAENGAGLNLINN